MATIAPELAAIERDLRIGKGDYEAADRLRGAMLYSWACDEARAMLRDDAADRGYMPPEEAARWNPDREMLAWAVECCLRQMDAADRLRVADATEGRWVVL